MAKNPHIERMQNLNNLSAMTDAAYNFGRCEKREEYEELKGKIRDAQMDNIFAAMAGYCM